MSEMIKHIELISEVEKPLSYNPSQDQSQDHRPPMLQQIYQLAEQVATREGCRLYDLEFVGRGNGRILRVFIDKSKAPEETAIEAAGGGVSLDDCANVSKGLSLLLDVEDIISGGAYHLEVSSPGLERKLSKPWHFESVIGKKIFIRTRHGFEKWGVDEAAIKKGKQAVVTLLFADTDGIRVQSLSGLSVWSIGFEDLERAKLHFELATNKHVNKK
jgi:ribosome maturation factor RimP